MKLTSLTYLSCFNLLCMVSCYTHLPFKIPGPISYKDKIAIVGAGASGIHMALELKKKGFTNIEILEKESYIGGKSWTVNHRGADHEMGSVYLAPDYVDNVIPLVNEYLPGDLVVLPPASIWLENLPGFPISYEKYLVKYAMDYFNTSNITVAIGGMARAIMKYIALHGEIFGAYEGEIMPEPTPQVLRHINGTFLEFLKRHKIDAISPILYAASSVQGYGRLDEIACLYGMMWNTPKLMKALLARLAGNTNQTGLYMLKSGFKTLWQQIITKENLRVTFNVDIFQVYRTKCNDYKDIWLNKRVADGNIKWEHYDFLIWSPEMRISMKAWQNKEIEEERFYFSLTKPTYFTTALIDTEGVQKGSSPIDYWFDNINKKREGSLWAQRDSYAALRGYKGDKYKNGDYPSGNDGKSTRSTVTYQMSDDEPFYTELKGILKSSLQKIGAKKITVLHMKIWRYFPRYSPGEVEKGYLWRVLEMQGKYGMWYIGSSVSFESVKSVIEYNKMILKNMQLPSK